MHDYLAVLRRRKWVIFLAVALVVGSTVAFSSLQTPVYEAHARVLLQPERDIFQIPSAGVRVETEIQVMESAPVQDLVRERLGVAPRVSVVQVGATEVVDVSAESTLPAEAANVANAYAQSYTDFRRQQAINGLLAAGEQIQLKVTELQKQIDRATEAATAAATANQRPNQPAVTNPTNPERDALIGQQALFKQKLDQLQVDASLKDGGAQVVSPAVRPTVPVRPRPLHNGALALVAGLVLGLAAAFFLDHLDDSIKSGSDLEHAGSGLSLLGVIPSVVWKDKSQARVVSLTDPDSPASEAYRTLRTSITFLALDRKMSVLQVTSPSASEGKTTTIVNLAVAMAQAGQRVILIDCDLRRPRIHEFFGLDNDAGLVQVLFGSVPLSEALHRVHPRIRVLTAGPRPTNPSELLASSRASEVLEAARSQADFVLVDCPPILPVTDAAVLSAKVDGTLVIANAGATNNKDVAHAQDLLKRVDAPIIGAVLNGATSDGGYGYGYGFSYKYEPVPTTLNGNGNGNGRGKSRREKKGRLRQSGS